MCLPIESHTIRQRMRTLWPSIYAQDNFSVSYFALYAYAYFLSRSVVCFPSSNRSLKWAVGCPMFNAHASMRYGVCMLQ